MPNECVSVWFTSGGRECNPFDVSRLADKSASHFEYSTHGTHTHTSTSFSVCTECTLLWVLHILCLHYFYLTFETTCTNVARYSTFLFVFILFTIFFNFSLSRSRFYNLFLLRSQTKLPKIQTLVWFIFFVGTHNSSRLLFWILGVNKKVVSTDFLGPKVDNRWMSVMKADFQTRLD